MLDGDFLQLSDFCYCSPFWLFWGDYKDELAKYGQAIHYIPPQDSSFTPYSVSKYPSSLLTHIVIDQAWAILLIFLITVIALTSVVFILFYTLPKFRQLDQWDKDYLVQSYFLNFQTRIPEGYTNAEKILSLARSVFPELRPDFSSFSPSIEDRIKWLLKTKKDEHEDLSKSLNYVIDSYSLDLALKMKLGYFIV